LGPRDVVITNDDQVVVSDTGNKRIVVFDLEGNAITEFGEADWARVNLMNLWDLLQIPVEALRR